MPTPIDTRTERRRSGDRAEQEAAYYLEGMDWRVLARNLKVGRDEIDILAIDAGPPATLVVVEVRGLQTRAFGSPEERVDRGKVGRLYRALAGVGAAVESGEGIARLPRRVDLVIVDRRSGRTEIRHLRALEPP